MKNLLRSSALLLALSGLSTLGVRASFAEDPPAPEAPAPEAPAPEAPAPEAPAPDAPAPDADPAPDAPAADAAPSGEGRVAVPAGPRRWMLGVSHGPLRVVRDGGQAYHYVLLTVENKTKVARPWQPFVQAVTDTGRTHVACGCGGALEQLKRKERDASILSVEASAGKIAPNERKRFAAIFGPIDTSWSRLTLYVHGLVDPTVTHLVARYGEADVIVQDPAYADRNAAVMERVTKAAKESGGAVPAPTKEYKEFTERRAYAIEWKRMGDEFRPESDPIEFVREGWRILGDPKVVRTLVPKYGGS